MRALLVHTYIAIDGLATIERLCLDACGFVVDVVDLRLFVARQDRSHHGALRASPTNHRFDCFVLGMTLEICDDMNVVGCESQVEWLDDSWRK